MRILMSRRQVLASALPVGLSVRHRRGQWAPSADAAPTGIGYTPAGYPIRDMPFSEVRLTDSFWQPRITTNARVSIPLEVRKFEEGGRPIGNNVLQAAIYSLQTHPDAGLQERVDARIREMRQTDATSRRNGNAFFEVAAAHFRATGRRDLLDLAIKSADSLYETYRSTPPPFSGGERDAINCVELYRATNEPRYLDLAKIYLDLRGLPNSVNRSRHNQSHEPVLQQREAVGHAVNAASLMVSLVDVGMLTGRRDYFDAARRMWLDVVATKMYITGGIGSTGNEGFGRPHSLPNLSAYAETCAAIMFATFNHKMFLATGDAAYIDVMERAMYNNILSGVSSSGDHFFYVNRLASAGDGRDTRWQRASLECCPPNLVRFMASMPGCVYAQATAGDIYVNLYVSGEASFKVRDLPLSLKVESAMPWGGRSTITATMGEPMKATIRLRVPGWARNRPAPGGLYTYTDNVQRLPSVSINGSPSNQTIDESGYVSLDREWRNGDVVQVDFPFDVRRVVADERITADRGRTALERGPIVYCVEGPDAGGRSVFDLLHDTKSEASPSVNETLHRNVVVIRSTARSVANPALPPAALTFIPYHLWANRGAAQMSVWLPCRDYVIGDIGPAGGLIFYVNPNHVADGWRYLEAAPADVSAGAAWGCFRTEIPGARGTAVGTGAQNTRDILAACRQGGTAAELCATYRLSGIGGWFLPSIEELAHMYLNLKVTGACTFGDDVAADNVNYWSSSQVSADMARHLDFADNGRRWHYDDKDYPRRVRAVRAF